MKDNAFLRWLSSSTPSIYWKAYEPDGMKIDAFITFGSCNRTLDQFVNDGWNVLRQI